MSHYETLEVSRNASPEVIRAAYKSLIQRYHPDKNLNNAEATTKAQQISVAFAVLSVPESRAAYDATFFVDKQSSVGSGIAQEPPAGVTTPRPPTTHAEPTYTSRRVVQPQKKGGGGALIASFGIAVVAVIGISLWRSESKKQEELSMRAFETSLAKDAIDKAEKVRQENETKKEKVAQDKALDLSRRTLSIFPKNISLNLIVPLTYPPQFSGRVLAIPQISLIVGKINSERVVANVQQNQQVLIQGVFEQLSRVDYRVLITVDAEAHIKKVIQTTINKITLGVEYRDEDLCRIVSTQHSIGPDEFQCRAIESVSLPQSFVLRDQNHGISPTTVNTPPISSGILRPNQRLHPSMSKEEVYRILGRPTQ